MDSSPIGKSSLAHHGHKLIYLAVTQSLIIVWLALWNIGDYLNNIYVRNYVDGMIALYGWLIILAVVGCSLGSSWMYVHKHHRITGKTVEAAVKGSKPPKITPTVLKTSAPSAPSSGLNPKLASIGIRTSTFSTPQASTSTPTATLDPTATPAVSFTSSPSQPSQARPTAELHPAVAALKAELSERRVSLGLVTATVGQDDRSGPNDQPQPAERSAGNVLESRPQQRFEQPQMSHPQLPPTVIRPSLPPGPVQRPMQPVPPPRPVQPFGFGRPPQPGQNNPMPNPAQRPQQPGNADRFEDAMSRAGFTPTNNQAPSSGSQVPPPVQRAPVPFQPPRNVTTVITGIMPTQKKKDPADPNDQNTSTSQ